MTNTNPDYLALKAQAEMSGNEIDMLDDTARAVAGSAMYQLLEEACACMRAHGIITQVQIDDILNAFLAASLLKLNTVDPERTILTSQ